MKMKRISIALLLVLALMGTLLAGCGQTQQTTTSEPATTTVAEEIPEEDLSADVLVIGAGGAGMAAAIEAHDAGKHVIIVEKMPFVGGNTIRATGGLNAAGTSSQAAAGIVDSPEVHYADTMKGGYDINNPALVEVLTQQAAPAVEWLIELGADLSDVGRLAGSTNNRSHRPAGGAAVGANLVEALKNAVQSRGIETMLNTTALELILENGRVIGAMVDDGSGEPYPIYADAVVLTAGGFGANNEMVAGYDPSLEGFGTTNSPGATGEGIAMAQAVGAAVVDMIQIQTHPTVVPEIGYMITEAVRGNGAIMVNRTGSRFVDEMTTRDVASAAMLEQEGKTGFLLFDQGIRESLSAIESYVRMGLTIEADTLEELAEIMDMDPEILMATVETYNNSVASGTDETFGRADMPRALDTPGYYLIEVGPAVHHTMGGLVINTSAQVLDESGNPIPGLFAAGEGTGGVHGGNRLGGNALADIIVFGRIAGQSASN
jgi:fumarate reductase flavoprotein subunit